MEFVRENVKICCSEYCGCYALYMTINGVKEGEYRSYYKNENIAEICHYISGKKEGEYKLYYPDGELRVVCNYKSDELEGILKFYENGCCKIENYKNGIEVKNKNRKKKY